jgi:hypothetical protein
VLWLATYLPSGSTLTARTVLGKPSPSPRQRAPSHSATLRATTSPASVNVPPTKMFPLGLIASDVTEPLRPDPSGDQFVPFQMAMLEAGSSPAFVKLPPATRSPLGETASAATLPDGPVSPFPIATQAAPSHFAMLLAGVPPIPMNVPAATSSPLLRRARRRAPKTNGEPRSTLPTPSTRHVVPISSEGSISLKGPPKPVRAPVP